MRNLDKYFKNRKIDYDRLLKYGFIKKDNTYTFEKSILDGEFKVVIIIKENEITSKLIEVSFGDEYLLADVDSAQGEFIGKIRENYDKVINDIIDHCTSIDYYKSKEAKSVIDYVLKKYGHNLEQPFIKYPEYSVWKQNDKWYGLMMTINESKFDKKGNKEISALNLKYQKESINEIIDNKGIFPGYHMNKNNWITVKLDGTVELKNIYKLIDNSYNLTKREEYWVIPSNTKFFDVIGFLKTHEEVLWHQNIKAHIGDIVYIYLGVPYSAIMFKCEVIEANIEGSPRKLMNLKIIERYSEEKYTLNELKKHGLTHIRCQRSLPDKTINYLKKGK